MHITFFHWSTSIISLNIKHKTYIKWYIYCFSNEHGGSRDFFFKQPTKQNEVNEETVQNISEQKG